MSRFFLGVDWGTHSSKWCFQDTSGRCIPGPLWDSTIWREGEFLLLNRFGAPTRSTYGEPAIKGRLIRNQATWEVPVEKLGVELGEAIVFSLLVLLSDAKETLKKRKIPLDRDGQRHIRFSHPNWMGGAEVGALQLFRDAIVVAIAIFEDNVFEPASDFSYQVRIASLKKIVAEYCHVTRQLPLFPATYVHSTFQGCLRGEYKRFTWQMVFESCAAGFGYLAHLEPGVLGGDEQPPRDAWVRKILVVDIGAGSTDAGYMLRTVQTELHSPLLIWFPAAPMFPRAGRWLTERLHEDWVRSGRKATPEEAEIYKISGVTTWYGKEFVREWCRSIAGAVRDYLRTVPDNVRLPKPPPLQLVVTGGSSAVEPVKAALRASAEGALRDIGIQDRLCSQTSLLDTAVGHLQGLGFSDTRIAQLAVSYGASHPSFADLKYFDEGLIH